ncbi:M48 family metalloprotease [Thermodesulfobacteriota bacterium]
MKFARHTSVLCVALVIAITLFFPKGALSITVQEEEELSREFMKYVLRQFELVKDPFIIRYVNNLGQKINAVIPDQNYKYYFYVIKEDTYNAFAGPGGHIFINSGLFEALESEEELVGILSHEIAHVECRHISQRIERSSKIQMATLAGMIAGILLGGAGAGTAASAVTTGALAAGQSVSLAYSREDERQSDQIGLIYLNEAGYSAEGLLTALKKIRSKQWFNSKQIPTYLTTHPASEERMVTIDTWIDRNEQDKQKYPPADPRNFQMAHTRLSALYGDESLVLRTFESRVKKFPDDFATIYGYGLILGRTGNRKDAIIYLKKALEKKAFEPILLSDLGRVYFTDGRYSEAMTTLEGATGGGVYDPDGLFYLGRTQMELGKLKDAASSFEKLIERFPHYSQAFYFLGETYGKLGELGNAHYYLGIYYIGQGRMKNGEFHLNKALNHLSDPDKKHKVEKMLAKIRKEPEKTAKED